ncbi:MAG: hypothetical protein HYY52_00045 [Candidatus Melainabacteria bacterium]|nr:hypothetical protein [Candidatus Melainabacteria bacterium]
MSDKLGLKNTKEQVFLEMKEKYHYYSELIRKYRLDTPSVHKEYCNSDDHRRCGAIWGHSSILLDFISKLWWWFTSEKPYAYTAKVKPKLQSITQQILWQRKEDELNDEEYSWLIKIKKDCEALREK